MTFVKGGPGMHLIYFRPLGLLDLADNFKPLNETKIQLAKAWFRHT